MNVVTRGVKNAVRSPLKSGAIILMFAISIALVLSMLVARESVLTKIDEITSSAGTTIVITPAGVRGSAGGGNPLTATQLTTITNTPGILSTVSSLTDQMGATETELESSLELGAIGARQQRFQTAAAQTDAQAWSVADATTQDNRPMPTPSITVTGTTDSNSVATDGGTLTLTSGKAIDATGSNAAALIGTTLAEKNSLVVGSTFTAYDQTLTVQGIYQTGNTFQDSGIILPLATLQTITGQAGVVTSVEATASSSDVVEETVAALTAALGDSADITSDAEQAAASVESLEGIASLTLAGVIASAGAGALIVLLSMVLVVRERRREIGVIKAIGGSNGKVITQFIVEGLTVTITGAVIGLALGILLSGPMTTSLVSSNQTTTAETTTAAGPGQVEGRQGGPGADFAAAGAQLNTNITQVTASLTPAIFFAALGITLLTALVGSAVPAWFTARIRPAEVLRTE